MKKFVVIGLMLLMAMTSVGFTYAVIASDTKSSQTTYSYSAQLDSDAMSLYNAMDKMYKDGMLKKGNASFDLVESGAVTQAQLNDYTKGNQTLSVAFQNARDAFFRDNAEIFYTDITKLTLRVGQISGNYVAYLSAGANTDYFAKGFSAESAVTTAITAATTEKNAIVTEMKKTLDSEKDASSKNSVYPQERIVELAHNALVNRLDYTYPSEENPYVSGVYAISTGKANCEGYSTLLKWILKDFNIDSVLVSGTAENSRKALEAHMWNYVNIYGNWYAVDTTWDDPMTTLRVAEVRDTYLLKGALGFNANHFAMGELSPAGMKFVYPTLSDISYEEVSSPSLEYTENGFKIFAKRDKIEDPNAKTKFDEVTNVSFTYQDKSIEELAKEGKYLAARFQYYGKAPERWAKLDDAFATINMTSKFNSIYIYKKGSIQFCITTINTTAAGNVYDVDLALDKNHAAISDVFNAPYYSNYVAPPFIHKSEPELIRSIMPEQTHFKVEYDEELVLLPNQTLSATIFATEKVDGAVKNLKMYNSTISNNLIGTRVSTIVEFDFMPDTSYQAYLNKYDVQLTGVVGTTSKKAPNAVPISVTFKMSIPCPTNVLSGYSSNNAFVISVPTLVVNQNADIFEYEDEGNPNALDIRLVATIPTEETKGGLEDASNESKILSSAVYDLTLSCSGQAARLKTEADYNLTIGLPYPEGYNYKDNSNVQFKAYHYIKKADGTFEVEELVCRIGERGLEVIAKSFSPFMVVAVPKSGEVIKTEKLVDVSLKTLGGDVTTSITANGGTKTASAFGLYAIKNGTKTFTVAPQAGFSVDKVLVNKIAVQLTNNAFTFDFATMQNDNTLEVFFIADSVKVKEAEKGIVPIITSQKRELKALTIKSLPSKTSYKVGEKIDLSGIEISAAFKDSTVTAFSAEDCIVSKTGELTEADTKIAISLKSDPSQTIMIDISVSAAQVNNNALLITFIIVAAVIVVAGVVVLLVILKKKQRA